MGIWENDRVLRVLERLPDPVGSLARAFPGAGAAASNQHWIDSWFLAQAAAFLEGQPPTIPTLISSAADEAVLDPLARRPTASSVRVLSILPHFFRGFRAPADSIKLGDDLVVIEGSNSSGKTSLSEAVEWLLTGALSRRTAGSPKELANCIANQFRPRDERTWVECKLDVDGSTVTLRRLLKQDYTETADSVSTSLLLRDDQELTEAEAQAAIDALFAGVHPILMQHTLRDFVCSRGCPYLSHSQMHATCSSAR